LLSNGKLCGKKNLSLSKIDISRKGFEHKNLVSGDVSIIMFNKDKGLKPLARNI